MRSAGRPAEARAVYHCRPGLSAKIPPEATKPGARLSFSSACAWRVVVAGIVTRLVRDLSAFGAVLRRAELSESFTNRAESFHTVPAELVRGVFEIVLGIFQRTDGCVDPRTVASRRGSRRGRGRIGNGRRGRGGRSCSPAGDGKGGDEGDGQNDQQRKQNGLFHD